jgi:hypothetical protein
MVIRKMNALIAKLQGEWKVEACGAAMPMNLLHDRKRITGRNGHNLIDNHVWGWFRVEGDGPELTLNYDDKRNHSSLRRIRDIICRDTNGWIGKLYLRNRSIFGFRLTKIPLKKR